MRMKPLIAFLCVLSSAGLTFAQGSLEFLSPLSGANQVPPNSSPYSGLGQFTLTGSLLEWAVNLNAPFFSDTGGFVHGPAGPGSTAPMLFDLGIREVVGPGPGNPIGGVVYHGSRTLTGAESADLNAGLWYVNITSDAYLNGEVRGQITLVPEPSAWALLAGGGLSVWLFQRKKQMA
jgi:hypothetical protein